MDTLRDHDSRPHCYDTVLRYAVTLQVSTHPNSTAKYRQLAERARNVTAYPTLDTLHGHDSLPHCYDIVLRYAVTLQLSTHPNATTKYRLHAERARNVTA
jgi:hypothetical protein